jgi:hypothetical protein
MLGLIGAEMDRSYTSCCYNPFQLAHLEILKEKAQSRQIMMTTLTIIFGDAMGMVQVFMFQTNVLD